MTVPATALPRFRMVAYTGSPMRVGGWRYPVIIDLAGLAIPSQSRPIRFGHDPLAGVGHTDAIRVEQGQLVATGVVSRDTAAAREVVASSKNGFPWQASVGAQCRRVRIRQGKPEGDGQRPAVHRAAQRGAQGDSGRNQFRGPWRGRSHQRQCGSRRRTASRRHSRGRRHSARSGRTARPSLSTGIARTADCRSSIRSDHVRGHRGRHPGAHRRRNRSYCRHPTYLWRTCSQHRVAGHSRRLERTTYGTGNAASYPSHRSRCTRSGIHDHGKCAGSSLLHGWPDARTGGELRRADARSGRFADFAAESASRNCCSKPRGSTATRVATSATVGPC